MITEIWKPLTGYEGLYEISDQGRVRSLPREVESRPGRKYRTTGRVLKQFRRDDGYMQARPSREGVARTILVHREVARAFVPGEGPGLEACHRNGDASDNRATNLRWGTHASNIADTVEHGTHALASVTHCPRGHPYDETNTRIRKDGRRGCRACDREQAAERRAAHVRSSE